MTDDTFTIECDKTEGYENEDFTFSGRATRDGLPVVPTNGLRWGIAIGYRTSTVPIFPITYDPITGLYIPDALLDDNGEFSFTLKPEVVYQNTGFTRTKYRSTFYIGLYEPTPPPGPPGRVSVRGASLDVIVHPVHGVQYPQIPAMDTVIYKPDTTPFGKSYTGQCVYEEAIFLYDSSNITGVLANCIPQDRIVPPPPNPVIQENKVLRVEIDSIYNAEQDKLLVFNGEQFYPFKVRVWSVPSDWNHTDPHTIYSIFPLGEIVYATSYPPSVGNIDESYWNEYQTWIPPIIPPDKGVLEVHAFEDGSEVGASVEIIGVGTRTTPFAEVLDPGSYDLNVTFKGAVKKDTVVVVASETTKVDYRYTPFDTWWAGVEKIFKTFGLPVPPKPPQPPQV